MLGTSSVQHLDYSLIPKYVENIKMARPISLFCGAIDFFIVTMR